MIAKTRLGCLPLRIETARYSIPRLPEGERKCLICRDFLLGPTESEPVENETHFLFQCCAYKAERRIWFSKMILPSNFNSLDCAQKLKIVLNDACNVKFSSQFILNAFNVRSKILKWGHPANMSTPQFIVLATASHSLPLLIIIIASIIFIDLATASHSSLLSTH